MPINPEQFFAIFAAYHTALGPVAPVAAWLLGAAALALSFVGRSDATRAVLAILALLWAVGGIGYLGLFLGREIPAMRPFAGLFALQALLLGRAALARPGFVLRPRRRARSVAGLGLAGFALVVYPVWGWMAGQHYPAMPVFGLAPCPTTIFTIGLLLLGPWRRVRWLLAIPALWALVGGSAVVAFGVPQDAGLIIAFALLALVAAAHAQARPRLTPPSPNGSGTPRSRPARP